MRSAFLAVIVGVASCGGATGKSRGGTAESSGSAMATDAPSPVPPEAIDVMLAIDMSKTMEETDVPPDRLEATKRAVRSFLASSTHDRFGLVIYAQQALRLSPLTTDSQALDRAIANLAIGDVPELGTAMGDGLALAVDDLRTSGAKHRVVILLADGESNWVNAFDPEQATDAAKALGIRVYTVLVGRESTGQFGGAFADPTVLQHIAATTDGGFYEAADPAAFDRGLEDVRAKLDALKQQLGP